MSEQNTHKPRRRGPGHGPGGMMMAGEKARDFKGTMKKLIEYLRVYRLSMIIVFIFAAGSAALSIVGPRKIGDATTILFDGLMAKIAGTGSIDFDAIERIILTLLALYIISSLLGYLQGWIMSGITMKITYKFRKDISEK
jgi:hypothetical protein